ncbi:unnamed protein product, partial [Soboliphyme baturini]|uniref:Ribosomal_L28e domain-containing protein n=1 Tax=Soboliphyme baturini TaxID=241478 RepID=A0A183J873_9BILA
QEAEDHSIADDEEFSTDSEYSGEDAEIQAAYKFGLLKPGLNIMKTKQLPGPPINNEEGLRKKLCEFKSKNQWLERMDVTVDRPVESTEDDRENDFLREVSFETLTDLSLGTLISFGCSCEQAKRTVAEGIAKLHAMKILTKRPTDYFAEMAKSDEHMQRVTGEQTIDFIRTSLMKLKTAKERSEAAKRVREEKRFAVRVQRQVLKARQVQKRTLADAVKKHQKGELSDGSEMNTTAW